MPNTTIRRAGLADAPVLAELGARTFSEKFGHLYPPQDLAAFLAKTHAADRVAAELSAADMAVWLAESGGAAVGYALAGPCGLPHPDVTTTCGELKRIYVLADRQGEGLGARLMDLALSWLGRRPVWLGVWSGNLGAQRFYDRIGFRKVGEYDFHVGATIDLEFIYRRD
jgi:ribosomal protein S18 acetylase RimI-like enzyme